MASVYRWMLTSEAMLCCREGFVFDGCDIGAYRSIDAALAFHEISDEACLVPGEGAEHVMHDQDLAGAIRAGADADGGHRGGFGDFFAHGGRYRFQHHDGSAGGFQCEHVRLHLRGSFDSLALHLEAAELMYRLRRKAHMR